MQTKRAVERQRAIGGARRSDRQFAMQTRIIRIPMRRDGRQAVERAAQDHHHQPRGGCSMGKQNVRYRGARGKRSCAHQETAPTGIHMQRARHLHLL